MLNTLQPFGAKLIASGGVSAKNDILSLLSLAKDFNNLEGAIVGKAIYERRVDLPEIIKLADTYE